ncbi:MAG: aminopeptidase [archaeon]
MNIDYEDLADKLVNKSLSIGRKRNPNIDKAKEEYGEEIIKKIKKDPNNIDQKMIRELSEPEYGPLIHEEKGRNKFKEEIGHTVVIECHPNNMKLAREIERKCLEKGAHTLLTTINKKRAIEKYELPPTDSLKELTELSRSLAEKTDYRIIIEPIESTNWKKGTSKEKIAASAPVQQKLNEIKDDNKVRWSYIGWPHPEIAEELGITYEKFKKVLKNTLEESFKPEMKEKTQRWHEKLKNAKKIRIISEEGTDLTLDIEGREILEDNGVLTEEDIERGDVGMNFPCGEVFTAPNEEKVNGKIFIPKTAILGYGTVKELWLEFKDGRIISYSAEENEEYIGRFFEENTGNIKTIAELGIGCNKEAEYTEGYILIDEKIEGTIHIAVGWNIGYGGKNKSSGHHDFIKPMEKGKMYADEELVMDNGKPVW